MQLWSGFSYKCDTPYHTRRLLNVTHIFRMLRRKFSGAHHAIPALTSGKCMHTTLSPAPPPQNLQYGTHGALKPPKRVWGKSRNVTDNSPTRLGALRVALSYQKHSGVSWVWLAIGISVKVKCTLRGLMLRVWAIWGRFGPIRVTPRESHGICNRHV